MYQFQILVGKRELLIDLMYTRGNVLGFGSKCPRGAVIRAARLIHISTTMVFLDEADDLSHQRVFKYQFSKSHPKFIELESQ